MTVRKTILLGLAAGFILYGAIYCGHFLIEYSLGMGVFK